MAKTRPPYTPEFRRQMVELVSAGRSPEELAQEFEPTAQSRLDTDRSRMRESRTYGSARGAGRDPRPYRNHDVENFCGDSGGKRPIHVANRCSNELPRVSTLRHSDHDRR